MCDILYPTVETCRVPDLAVDGPELVGWAGVMLAVSWLVRWWPIAPAGRRILRRRAVDKFSQSVVEAISYGAFWWMTWSVVAAEDWALDPRAWWRDRELMVAFAGSDVRRSATLYMSHAHAACYLLYGARYVQTAVSVVWETRRKDFRQMVAHHVLTVAVVLTSYAGGYARVGLVIMALFEPADVFLHAAKLCKYVGDARRSAAAGRAADGLFVAFMTTFFVLRLVVFPYACWTALVVAWEGPLAAPLAVSIGIVHLLLVLNVYWAVLIVRVLARMLADGHAADDRSDSDE
jgi:hypothetical protein